MDVDQEYKSAARRSVVLLTVLGALSQLLGFGYRVALSRMVGAEVMGLYQLVMPAFSVLLSLTAVGLTAAVSNLTSQYLAWENSRGAAQIVSSCLRWLVLLILPVGAAVIVFSDPISVYLLGDARTQLGLMLLVPCAALTGVENIHKHFFYGAGLVGPPAVVELLEQLVRTAAVLGLLTLFLPQYPERVVGLIVTGMVICELFSSATLSALFHRRKRRKGLMGPGERAGIRRRRIATIALPVGCNALLGNVMGAINATLIPRKLVEGGMDRSAAMAEFGVVCGMTLPMLALPTVFLGAMNLVMVPRLSHCAALGHKEEIRENISQSMTTVSLLALPSMGLMAVVGSDLGGVLFHQDGVGEFLVPLAAIMALSCYQAVLGAALNGVGRQGSVAWISILCDGVQLALTAWLVPKMGMEGFVVSTGVSTVLGLLLCAQRLIACTGLRLELFRWLTAPGLATLLMALTTNLLVRALKDWGTGALWANLAGTAFGVVLYLAALSAQGVKRQKL